jgi:hypothetical protein
MLLNDQRTEWNYAFVTTIYYWAFWLAAVVIPCA